MKKHDLLELTILGIGVWATYQCILAGFMLVFYLVQLGIDGFRMDQTQGYLVRNIILGIAYYLVSYFALRKTDHVLNYLVPSISKDIAELGQEPTAQAEKPPISKADIMRMIVVGVGIFLTVPQVPQFIENLYLAFKSRVGRNENTYEYEYLLFSVSQILFPALLIIFSKKITAYLKL